MGCATFSEDARTLEQPKFDRTLSIAPVNKALTPSSEAQPMNVAASLDPSFYVASPEEPTWRSLIARPMVKPCSSPLAFGQPSDEANTCGKQELMSQEAFRLKDDVPLRPPTRQLWFNHPRLVPLSDGESLVRVPLRERAYRDRVGHVTFRNPYTGLRDQPLLHRDPARSSAPDSTVPDVGPPPSKHSLKTFGTLIGMSLMGIGVYAFAPTSFTGASKDEDVFGEALDHFKNAWTKPPVFDQDRAVVNYLGHPYFGMNYYLSQRNYGESPLYSFLFATLISTGFEYFIESWSERPSITDLIITPIVGAILGELVYQATQKMRKDGFTTAEKIMITVINPLYVFQNGYH
jgi:hypothetical protein